MTKQQIIDYVLETPNNTNPAILGQMINEVENSSDGGSSDFSTATVTVNNNAVAALCAPFVVDEDGYTGMFIANSSSGEFDLALYKGMCQATFVSPDFGSFNVVVTGNITYNDAFFFITGDGTITISE